MTLPGSQYSGVLDNRVAKKPGYNGASRERLYQWQDPLPLCGPEPETANYPMGALGRFADAAETITNQVQTPAPIVGQSILATASLMAQQHIDVEIDGRESPVSLFLVTVAASGERKTSADRIVLAPIKAYERSLLEAYKNQYKNWAAELMQLKTKKRGQAIDHRAIIDHEDDKPPYPMILTKEPSYEGLVRSLHEGLPSMGLFSDEGGRFIGGYAMSDEHMLKTAAGLCELWDGTELNRNRGADRQTYTLHDRRLAMHLMLQPIVAYNILNSPLLLGQGFLPRCLVVQPKSRIGSRMYVEKNTRNHPAVQEMSSRFSELLRVDLITAGHKSQRNVTLDPDAKAYWIELHNEFETKAASEYEPIQAMACKAAEQVARIAAVLAYVDDSDVQAVPLVDVERAAALMGFYLHESLRIRQIAEADQRIKLAQKCIEWAFNEQDKSIVQPAPNSDTLQFHTQGFLQYGPGALRTKKKMESILKFLHEHGLARKVSNPTKFGEKERKQVWEIRKFESNI